MVHTGVFLTEDDMERLRTNIVPMHKYGSEPKQPWEVLQEIAREKGLPDNPDYYGLTIDGEIVARSEQERRERISGR